MFESLNAILPPLEQIDKKIDELKATYDKQTEEAYITLSVSIWKQVRLAFIAAGIVIILSLIGLGIQWYLLSVALSHKPIAASSIKIDDDSYLVTTPWLKDGVIMINPRFELIEDTRVITDGINCVRSDNFTIIKLGKTKND